MVGILHTVLRNVLAAAAKPFCSMNLPPLPLRASRISRAIWKAYGT